MHRDLKPGNIKFNLNISGGPKDDRYPFIKILDFGYAEFFEKKQFIHYCCGTVGYMCPSVLDSRNKTYGPKCDIYAVGIILYEVAEM